MLDVNELCEQLDTYRERLATRQDVTELKLDEIAALNARRKALQKERDDLVHEQRELGPKIGAAKKAGEDAAELQARSTEIKAKIKEAEETQRGVETELGALLLLVPNLPHAEAPLGGEEDGVIQRTWGEAKAFDFEAKSYEALIDGLGLAELGERATRLAGSSFVTYVDQGARLVRGLINFFLDLHTLEHGYTEVAPPFVVNAKTMTGTGQLPKFEEDQFKVPFTDNTDYWLVPTAEVPVTNLYNG